MKFVSVRNVKSVGYGVTANIAAFQGFLHTICHPYVERAEGVECSGVKIAKDIMVVEIMNSCHIQYPLISIVPCRIPDNVIPQSKAINFS